jgi:hypothetical protein
MKTFGQVINGMTKNKNVKLIPVCDNLLKVNRGNGNKKPSTITVRIPDDMIDMFFNNDKTTAFMVCLDRESTNKIARG